jgi:hypothetical protein
MTKKYKIGDKWTLHSIITFFIFICLYVGFNGATPTQVQGNYVGFNGATPTQVQGNDENVTARIFENHTPSDHSKTCCYYRITGISQGEELNFTVPIIDGKAEIQFDDLFPKGPGWHPDLDEMINARLICCENATDNQTQS